MSFRENRQGEKCYRGEMSLGRNGLIPFDITFDKFKSDFLKKSNCFLSLIP